MGCSKSCSKREVYSNTSLPQETRKISNNLTVHLKKLEKEEQTKPKVSRRKEIIKIRAEINEIETRKTIAKISKTKSWFFENEIESVIKNLPTGSSLVAQWFENLPADAGDMGSSCGLGRSHMPRSN